MKFIFAIGYYNDYIDANCKIAVTIGKQLLLEGHSCKFITYSFNVQSKQIINYDGVPIEVIPANKKAYKLKRKFLDSKLNKLFYGLIHPVESIMMIYNRKYDYKDVVEYINHYIDENTYLVGFINPTNPTYTIINNTNSCVKIVYQLDPWGLFENRNNQNVKQKEINLFEVCDYVFTTDILYNQYKNDGLYKDVVNKIDYLNFPNLKTETKKYDVVLNLDDNYYNIIYTGTIDDNVRNPSAFLSTVDNLIKNYKIKIRMYFIGKINSKNIKESDNVFVIPSITPDVAESIINQDNIFLLNINNSITNMSPSKLIDYISTGNPIINVVKNEEDISEKILCKYDNHFSFRENESNIEEGIINFLENTKGRKIEKDIIIDKYYEYTSEYVVKKIIDTISR